MTIVIEIDPTRQMIVNGKFIGAHLSPREEWCLRAIAGCHSSVATNEYLLDSMYGGQDEPEIKIIQVFVCRLRTKLGEHRGAILTVWGKGFAWDRAYSVAPAAGMVSIDVDAQLLADVAFEAGQRPPELIASLLQREHDRLWALVPARAA